MVSINGVLSAEKAQLNRLKTIEMTMNFNYRQSAETLANSRQDRVAVALIDSHTIILLQYYRCATATLHWLKAIFNHCIPQRFPARIAGKRSVIMAARILVVEDEERIRQFLHRGLSYRKATASMSPKMGRPAWNWREKMHRPGLARCDAAGHGWHRSLSASACRWRRRRS